MADFKKFYPTLKQNEGGYANHPKDVGGETYAGIARNYWPKWPGWKIIDAEKNKLLGLTLLQFTQRLNKALKVDTKLQDMIFQFYKVNFWNSLQLDFVVSQPLAEQLADMGVNSGPMRPAKMVQWILKNQDWGYAKLVVDGDLGPASIKAINAVDIKMLYRIFVELRKRFYYHRAAKPDFVTEVQAHFFSNELNLRPKADQAIFLSSWLSRCVPATI